MFNAIPATTLFLAIACLSGVAETVVEEADLQQENGCFFMMAEQEFPVDSISVLLVHNDNGAVSVEGWDEARAVVRAERSVKAESDGIPFIGGKCLDEEEARELLGKIKVAIEMNGKKLEATGKTNNRGLNSHNPQVKFTIYLPKHIASTVNVGNGKVVCSNLQAPASIAIGNGAIQAERLGGALHADVGNGEIQLTDVSGDMDLSTGNGAIRGENLAGNASAKTGNGKIDMKFGKLAAAPNIHCKTNIGEVALGLPSGQSFNVDMASDLGKVECGYPLARTESTGKTHIKGTAGTGGGEVVLRTDIGKVSLEQQ